MVSTTVPTSQTMRVAFGLAIASGCVAAAMWFIHRRQQSSLGSTPGAREGDATTVVLHGDHGNHGHNRPPTSVEIVPPADQDVNPDDSASSVDPEDRRRALELFHTLKSQGNHAFSKGAMHDAMRCYQDSLDVLSMLPVDRDHELRGLANVVRANVMLVLLKLECFEDVRMLGTFLLQEGDVAGTQTQSVPVAATAHSHLPQDLMCKVLFRRAAAMVQLGDLDGALGDLRAAKKLSVKDDPAIEAELRRVEKLVVSSSSSPSCE